MKEIIIKVNGMSCGGCENRIKNSLSMLKGVEHVNADYKTGIVTLTLKEEMNVIDIEEKIKDIGFEVAKDE